MLNNILKTNRLIVFKSSFSAYNGVKNFTKCQMCQSHRWTSNQKVIGDEDVKQEVYYGVLTPQIRGVKMFSLMTSVSGIVAQPVLHSQVTQYGGGMGLTIALGSFIGFFTFVTPFLLHTITRKYVTKIDYYPNKDTYSLTTLNFFLRPKTVEFTPSDVEVPDVLGMFTSFNVKGRPVFVDARLFPDPNHYAKIMGYDKPMDFKLGNPNDILPSEKLPKQ